MQPTTTRRRWSWVLWAFLLLCAVALMSSLTFLGLMDGARDGLIPARGIKTRAQQMHIYIIGAMMQARITNRLEAVGAPLEAALLAISGLGAAR